MADALKQFTKRAAAMAEAPRYKEAAKVMAKDFDRRRKIAVKALRGIDTYAWSMVNLPAPARKELQKRIDACRKALAEI